MAGHRRDANRSANTQTMYVLDAGFKSVTKVAEASAISSVMDKTWLARGSSPSEHALVMIEVCESAEAMVLMNLSPPHGYGYIR
jgi:hypothetical protein